VINQPAAVLLDVRIVREALTGVGRYLVGLMNEIGSLQPRDLELTAVGRADQPLLSGAVSTLRLSGQAGRSTPLGLAQHVVLKRSLRRQHCDLYHYPNFDVPPLPVTRVVATCYDLEPLRHPELFSKRIVCFYGLLSRRLRNVDRVITISENTARDVHELLGIPRERITPVHLGVDPTFARPSRDERRRVSRSYRLPERFVLYLGNTMPHKNVERLVDAISIVRRSCPDVALIIGGAADKHRASVERAVARHGLDQAVRFLGKVPEADLPALLSSAAVFAFPSLYEGFGLPVLEAMACGAPVVTSTRSSLPEVVADAAVTVEPTDASAIAGALVAILDNPGLSARLSERGISRAGQFTWRRCAEAHLQVYREVLAT
jgi:glycosyltransferase involved in cell wall biosynthesis